MRKLRMLKTELYAHLGLIKRTALRQIEILCSDESTPFTYKEYCTSKHYIKTDWAEYILKNL